MLVARARLRLPSAAERLRAVLGAVLGVLFVAALTRWMSSDPALWLIAPVGASAVLVFTAPASPLAQPWPVVAGNTLSALVGVLCAQALPGPMWAAALAVGAAITLMMLLRCLHPPGGAVALLMVLMHEQSWSFVLSPVLTNSVLLVLSGMVYNSLSGHPYPHRVVSGAMPDAGQGVRVSEQDLRAALKDYTEVLDVAPDELARLLRRAEGIASDRLWGSLMCRDIMTPEPITVDWRVPLSEAWSLMQRMQIKALPVVDLNRQVTGILTQGDVLRHAGHEIRVSELKTQSPSSGAAVRFAEGVMVGDAMTRQVRVASASSQALDLLPLFSAQGHHHLPVIDEDKRLVGILTQTDLVRALGRVIRS
ncbi:MAG: HPP family protein [Limnohabitans sp.]